MSTLLIAAVLALGIARLTLIAVKDDIFEPVRRFVFRHSNPHTGWWGQVWSCPDCMGPYVATVILSLYYFWPTVVLYAMTVFAVSMVTSLVARLY